MSCRSFGGFLEHGEHQRRVQTTEFRRIHANLRGRRILEHLSRKQQIFRTSGETLPCGLIHFCNIMMTRHVDGLAAVLHMPPKSVHARVA
jgi:hypothetical protein